MQTKFLALPFVALTLALAVPAHAEPASDATKSFIEKATIGGMFEVESSKVALTSANPEVKAFAQQMLNDHTKSNAALKVAIANSGLTNAAAPISLDKEHAEDLAELKTKKGKELDETYVEDQQDVHEDAISLFKGYAADGDNAVLKKFAADTLPTLEAHQKHIDTLDKAIN